MQDVVFEKKYESLLKSFLTLYNTQICDLNNIDKEYKEFMKKYAFCGEIVPFEHVPKEKEILNKKSEVLEKINKLREDCKDHQLKYKQYFIDNKRHIPTNIEKLFWAL